jgi:hypothetical protein
VVDAKYTQIGKTVHYRISFKFGTGSVVGDARFTLPVASVGGNLYRPIGQALFVDNSRTQIWSGTVLWLTPTIAQVAVNNTGSGTYSIMNALTANTPFTSGDAWAANDGIEISGTYEAA